MADRPPEIPFEPPFDQFERWQEDWRGTKEEQISITAGFHVQQAWVVRRPEAAAAVHGEEAR